MSVIRCKCGTSADARRGCGACTRALAAAAGAPLHEGAPNGARRSGAPASCRAAASQQGGRYWDVAQPDWGQGKGGGGCQGCKRVCKEWCCARHAALVRLTSASCGDTCPRSTSKQGRRPGTRHQMVTCRAAGRAWEQATHTRCIDKRSGAGKRSDVAILGSRPTRRLEGTVHLGGADAQRAGHLRGAQ